MEVLAGARGAKHVERRQVREVAQLGRARRAGGQGALALVARHLEVHVGVVEAVQVQAAAVHLLAREPHVCTGTKQRTHARTRTLCQPRSPVARHTQAKTRTDSGCESILWSLDNEVGIALVVFL